MRHKITILKGRYRTDFLDMKYGQLQSAPEGLRAPELPGVDPGGQPQESGGDSKAI